MPSRHKVVDVGIAKKFKFLFDPPLGGVDYRIAYGGRGSCKSWQFARALLILGSKQKLRILCAREYQSSIRDSVHRLLSDQAEMIGLGPFYNVLQSSITGLNGTEFIFKGIKKDPHEIKSLEAVDICWVEEAEAVSDKSWSTLIPTIRKEGSEIWITFNPALPTDPTWKRFVDNPPSRSIVVFVKYTDNPYLTDRLRREARELRRRDYDSYEHIWGGKPWRRTEAEVLFGKWRVEEFELDFDNPDISPLTGSEVLPDLILTGPYYGADWGFAHDPTVLVRQGISEGNLYIEYDERGVGLSMDDIDTRFRRVPGADTHKIYGDNSRPETINELVKRKLKVVPAPKWKGSVKDGIEFLRSFEEIIIHPRCKGWIEEARLYRYKTDSRTGDILPDIIDANNHGPDATRYGLSPLIGRTQRNKSRAWFPGMAK